MERPVLKKVQFLLFSVGVTAAVFGYLLTRVSWEQVVQVILDLDFAWLLLFLLFSFFMSLFRTWRYQLLLNVSGYRAANVPLFLITLVRNLFSDLLPARLGTLIYIYLVKSRLAIPLAPVVASYAHAFVFDIVALGVLVVPALAIAGLKAQSTAVVALVGVGLSAIGVAVIWLLPTLFSAAALGLQRVPLGMERYRLQGIEFLEESAKQLAHARQKGVYLRVLLLSLAVRACKYISLYMLFLGLVLPMGYAISSFPPAKVLIGLCSAELAASLPISGIAGFGAYEGAWALVFQLLGYPEEMSVVTSISHHLVTQVYGYSLGGAALLLLLVPWGRMRILTNTENMQKVADHGKNFWMKFGLTLVSLALLCWLLLPLHAGGGNNDKETELADGTEAGGAPPLHGAVVYERPAGIFVTEIGSGKVIQLADRGRHPRWSPDGELVAYIDGNDIVVVGARGKGARVVARAEKPGTLVFAKDGDSLFYSDGKRLLQLDLGSKKNREVLQDGDFRELGISYDNTRLAATVKTFTGYRVRLFDLETSSAITLDKGCSASISPDGRFVTINGPAHRKLNIYEYRTRKLFTTLAAPATGKFDNQYWSNHQDWLVSTGEGKEMDIYIHHLPTGKYRKITHTGDSDRGDLFVRSTSGR